MLVTDLTILSLEGMVRSVTSMSLDKFVLFGMLEILSFYDFPQKAKKVVLCH